MRFGQNFFLFLLVIISLFFGLFYFNYTSSSFSDMLECNVTVEKKDVNTDLLFPAGVACNQPSVSNSRPDISASTQWLAPIVWHDTFDLTVIDNIYKQQDITVAVSIFALGKHIHFLKDFLETAEQHFMLGYRVHYYVFTDLPDEVPTVKLGEGRQLTVIKTENPNNLQEVPLHRMEMIEKLIVETLPNKADYIFNLAINCRFYAHWGAESLGDLVAVLHAWLYGASREKFTYERRPESQAFIPMGEGDYYYGGAVIGGTLDKVHKLVKALRQQLDMDRANKIEAVWREESHLNKYFLYNKPTKLLSPEYLWDDTQLKPSHIKLVRFSYVARN